MFVAHSSIEGKLSMIAVSSENINAIFVAESVVERALLIISRPSPKDGIILTPEIKLMNSLLFAGITEMLKGESMNLMLLLKTLKVFGINKKEDVHTLVGS